MYFNPLPRKRENVAEIDVSAAEIDFNPLPRKRENVAAAVATAV